MVAAAGAAAGSTAAPAARIVRRAAGPSAPPPPPTLAPAGKIPRGEPAVVEGAASAGSGGKILVYFVTERGSRIVVRDKPKPFWWSPAGLRPKPYEHDGTAGVLLYNQNGALFGWTPTAIAAERPAERAAEAA